MASPGSHREEMAEPGSGSGLLTPHEVFRPHCLDRIHCHFCHQAALSILWPLKGGTSPRSKESLRALTANFNLSP